MTALQVSAQKDLQRIVEQIERLESEKRDLAADVADKYKEAKGKGFDTKVMRKIIAARRKSQEEREQEEAIYDTYAVALGLAGTPLGDYAQQVRETEKAYAQ